MFKKAVILSLVLGLMTTGAYAQKGEVAQEKEVPVTQEGNVSFDFRDADIRNVFRILSFKSGVNIVAGPEVAGVVTIKLDDVPWQQALEVILETYGYAYEKKGNVISVTTIENLKQRRDNATLLAEQESLETRVFTLNFGKASEIIESVGKMKSERGSIDFDERTNAVIVTDIHDRVELIASVVETLDTTTPQVLIEAKIVETILSDNENLGIDWTTQASIGGASRPITYPFKTGNTDSRFATDMPVPTTVPTYGTLSFTQFQAVLEILKTRTDTNILSNPRIVTLDNKEASIDVGVEYPLAKKFYNKETGAWELASWDKQKIGILLKVTPHVNSAGFVTLDINPKVTEILEIVTDSGSGSEAPKTSIEEVKTQIVVKGGDTLVIAGLIKDKLTDTKRKVPFLGDIPVFGLLFQKSEKEVSKTDLIIFMTPHIITPEIASES